MTTADFESFPARAVFDEHDEYQCPQCKGPARDKQFTCERCARPSELARRFRKDDLEALAESCNNRVRVQPCPLTLGHTVDGAPEGQQPEIVGYAYNFRAAYSEPHQRHILAADFFIRKDRLGEARTYPRVSVELWPKDKFIDPIALLRRTPQRDVGQWCYEAAGGKLRYSREDSWMQQSNGFTPPSPQVPPSSPREFQPPAPPTTGQQPPPPQFLPDPTMPPNSEDPDPGDMDRFMKCMKAYMKGQQSPGLPGVGQFPPPPAPNLPSAAPPGLAPPAEPERMQAGPGFPSSSNVSPPQFPARRPESYAKGNSMNNDEMALRLARLESEVLRNQKEREDTLKAAAAEKAALEERVNQRLVELNREREAERLEYGRKTAGMLVRRLVHDGYILPNPAVLVEQLTPLPEIKQLEKDREIRECYARTGDPARLGMVPVIHSKAEDFGPPQTTLGQYAAAKTLSTEKKIGFDEALSEVKKRI